MASIDAAGELWSKTDLKPSDVDIAELYDGFTFLTFAWLEALGFCGDGESGPFVDGGSRIALGGRTPGQHLRRPALGRAHARVLGAPRGVSAAARPGGSAAGGRRGGGDGVDRRRADRGLHPVDELMTLKDQAAVVGVGATPYYRRGQSWPQTSTEMAGKAVLAALDDAGLTIRDLDGFSIYSYVVRSRAARGAARRARGALRRVVDVGRWWFGRITRPRRGGDRGGNGRGVRDAHDAAAGHASPRRHHVGRREVIGRRRWWQSVRRERRVAVRRVHRQRGADLTRSQLLGTHTTAHAPVRNEARALRGDRDLTTQQRDSPPDVVATEPAHTRRLLLGAHDLGPDVPVRLHDGE